MTSPRPWALLAVLLLAALAPARAAEHRNVVLILADDLGWGDLSCYGHPRFQSPNLDRMAAEGARLTQFQTPMPFCAPSRGALMTGRYPNRNGLVRNPVPAGDPVARGNGDDVGLPVTERTLGQAFQQNGYRTAAFGKWHLGHRPQFRPVRRGFDEYFGVLYSNDMSPVELIEGDAVAEYPVVQATLTKRLTDHALDFIERNKDRPFFLYLPHHMPHKPLACSEDYYKKSGAGLYGDVIRELDAGVGAVLDRIKDLGLDEKTLVIFTSDNGPWYGGSTAGLRGMKGQSWEGGLRVPLIARLPGVIPAGHVSRQPAGTIDLFPTVLSLAGVPVPTDHVLDGKDITPLLTSDAPSPHEALFALRGERLATVRAGKWKLHLVLPGPANEKTWRPDEPWVDPRAPNGVTLLAPYEQAHPSQFPGSRAGTAPKPLMLFDLDADPAESVDRAAENPEIVQRLEGLARRFTDDVANGR